MTRSHLVPPTTPQLAPTSSEQARAGQQMRAGGSSQQMRAGGLRTTQAR